MADLHVEIYGEGHPIVMLHGWGMHSGVWRQFAEELARFYRVICVDLPGHGRSLSVDAFELSAVAKKIVGEIGESPCCWLGWSMGGLVALEIAQQFPERVSALIFIAANPCFVEREQWSGMNLEVLEAFAENLIANAPATLMRFLALQLHGLPEMAPMLKVLKHQVLECSPPSPEVLRSGLTALQQQDLRNVFANLICPVLGIYGRLDTLVPKTVAKDLAVLLPHCHIEVLPQAGHVPFLSHPQEVVRTIRAFVPNL